MKTVIQTAVQTVFTFTLLLLCVPEVIYYQRIILYFILSFMVSLIIRSILK